MIRDRIRILTMLEADSISGSAKGVVEFLREAERRLPESPAFDIAVLRFRRENTPEQNTLATTVRKLGVPLYEVTERYRFDRIVIPQLRNLVNSWKPDIVWSNSVKSHFLVRFAALTRSARWVASHHGYTTTNLTMRVYNQLDRWSLRAADCVLTVCQPFSRQLERTGVEGRRIHVQHMPIRPFEPPAAEAVDRLRRELGIDAGTTIILSIGRLSREKGHVDLLAAFNRLRQRAAIGDTRLVLVGEGPERSVLEKLRASLNLEGNVVLAGHRDDVRPFYALADIFVLPSHSEGSPNVLLEAMAAGVPVVAAAVGGVPEIAIHGRNALLAPGRDIDGLAASMHQLLNDGQLRVNLSTAAEEVVKTHTPEAYFKSLADVFCQALAQEKRMMVAPQE